MSLPSTSGIVRNVVLDDLDGRRRLLLHLGKDLEPAPAPIASQRVGAVGDVLQLLEDEARDDERAVDEARLDDLGDPAVDDRARVNDDARVARSPVVGSLGALPMEEPDGLGGDEEIAALGDGEAEHPEAEEERDAERQPRAERIGELGQRQAEEQAHEQADQQPHDGGHELRGRKLFHLAKQPAGGDDGEVREDREAHDDPRDDPRGDERAGVRGMREQPVVPACESEAHETTEGGPEHTDDADHVGFGAHRHERSARHPV